MSKLRDDLRAKSVSTGDMFEINVKELFVRPEMDIPGRREQCDDIVSNILTSGFWKNEPIEVVPRYENGQYRYEVQDGRRRYTGSERAHNLSLAGQILEGQKPFDGNVWVVVIKPKTDVEFLYRTLTANSSQKKPFTAFDEAFYFVKLNAMGQTHAEIAATLGKTAPYVTTRIRLAEIEPSTRIEIETAVKAGLLPEGAAILAAQNGKIAEVVNKIRAVASGQGSPIKTREFLKVQPVSHKTVMKHLEKAKAVAAHNDAYKLVVELLQSFADGKEFVFPTLEEQAA